MLGLRCLSLAVTAEWAFNDKGATLLSITSPKDGLVYEESHSRQVIEQLRVGLWSCEDTYSSPTC